MSAGHRPQLNSSYFVRLTPICQGKEKKIVNKAGSLSEAHCHWRSWEAQYATGDSIVHLCCGFINHTMQRRRERGQVRQCGAWETPYSGPKNEALINPPRCDTSTSHTGKHSWITHGSKWQLISVTEGITIEGESAWR